MGLKDAVKSAFVQDYKVSFSVYFTRMLIGLAIVVVIYSLGRQYIFDRQPEWYNNIGMAVVILVVYSFGYFRHKK